MTITTTEYGGLMFLPPLKLRAVRERPRIKLVERKSRRGHTLQVTLAGLSHQDRLTVRRLVKSLGVQFRFEPRVEPRVR